MKRICQGTFNCTIYYFIGTSIYDTKRLHEGKDPTPNTGKKSRYMKIIKYICRYIKYYVLEENKNFF